MIRIRHLNALALCAISISAFAAGVPTRSQDALTQFFSSKEARSLTVTDAAVEVCSDGCQRYESKRGVDNPRVWDVVFLHQYYYVGRGPREEFQNDYKDLVVTLMSRYAKLCPSVQAGGLPGCVIGYLGSRYDIQLTEIFEWNGEECAVRSHLIHSKTIYSKKCRKVKNASGQIK